MVQTKHTTKKRVVWEGKRPPQPPQDESRKVPRKELQIPERKKTKMQKFRPRTKALREIQRFQKSRNCGYQKCHSSE